MITKEARTTQFCTYVERRVYQGHGRPDEVEYRHCCLNLNHVGDHALYAKPFRRTTIKPKRQTRQGT